MLPGKQFSPSPSIRKKAQRNTRLDFRRVIMPRRMGPNSTHPLSFLYRQEPTS